MTLTQEIGAVLTAWIVASAGAIYAKRAVCAAWSECLDGAARDIDY
jgi:hypothetical protein